MTSPGRGASSISDEQIAAIASTVERRDHDRTAPPTQVWSHIAAQVSRRDADHHDG